MSVSSNPTNLLVNINSLVGRLSLSRTQADLTQTIRNMSTGIRIHSGRDDPQGFIASSMMRTDIVSMSQAVSNSQQVNSVLSAADSVLNEISSLMIELRALVTQAANTGVESTETLAALQMQADAILNSIDYMANSTAYKRQNLLDGSLDFSTYGINSDQISNLVINQANFQGRTEKDISVQILETARQAELYYPYGAISSDMTLAVGGTGGTQTLNFSKDATAEQIAASVNLHSDSTGVAARVVSQATTGSLALTSYGKDNDIILSASETGKEASNFVVRYTVPDGGNDTLSLNVTEGNGNDPTIIEVVLQTQPWESAEYRYNDGNSGFSIAAKQAGDEFNDMGFVINNVYGTGETTGIQYDLTSSPKTFTVNVSYNEANPADPNNTTAADLAQWIAEDAVAGKYFELSNISPADGSGAIVPSAGITQTKQGIDGGAVLTTAAEVVSLINNSSTLKDAYGNGRVNAQLPTDSAGLGIVSPFTEAAYYGDASENNLLQFLGPADSPNIVFVSEPGSSLSIDNTTYPAIYGKASATVQGLDAGTSFVVKSLDVGAEYDGVGVIFRDSMEEGAVFDPERNAIVVSVDFNGRASDPNRDAFTMNDLVDWFSEDPMLSSHFMIEPMTAYDRNNPPVFDNAGYIGIDAQVGELNGGLVSSGTIIVHLETDKDGNVKTTANDLVQFFNDPPSEQAQAVLDSLGISVSSIDPGNSNTSICTTGNSSNGVGILKPTYDPNDPDCGNTTGLYPNISFGGYGSDLKTDYPTATVVGSNGIDSNFTVTAKQAGATYNNTTVRIVSDSSGPKVQYSSLTKELVVSVSPDNPMTADEIIELINRDSSISELFVASRGTYSNGSGIVSSGDRATLTGGIQAEDNKASTEIVSSNGVNAMFEITAKKSDAKYDNTEVLIVADENGPVVSYDSQTKQLTIGINPANPPTALEVIELINSTPDIMNLFEASLPTFAAGTELVPTGEDTVQVGDGGILKTSSGTSVFGVSMIPGSDAESLGLVFYSVEYGANEFVSVTAVGSSDFPLTDRNGNQMQKTYGTDIAAKIDGQLAIGNGRIASLATSDLDLSIWIDPSVQKGDVFGFRIDGGGALIQMGPEVNATHQTRIGIQSVHTSSLGGVSGRLSDILTGNEASLINDPNKAFQIIEEVTEEIASLRGRLGAFQKYRLETNIDTLTDLIEIETAAMGEIKDADYAVEASNLTRQQLLMQANISALQMSSQVTQMLLSLLQ